jgi:hypothetical protein
MSTESIARSRSAPLSAQDDWAFSRDNLGVAICLRGKSRPLEETQTCVEAAIISTHL